MPRAAPSVAASRRHRVPGLAELARLHGVQSFYYDFSHGRRSASPEALIALLRALGAPVERPADVGEALRARREASWRTPLEPVHLAWDGRPLPIELRLPAVHANARAQCTLAMEDGDARVWRARLAELEREAEHEHFVAKRLPLPSPLPAGYHRLRIEGIGQPAETLVISAPRRAYGPDRREWAGFLPLYALRSRRSLALGDLGDLHELARWLGALGGSYVGTLPLFAAFLDPGVEPFEPSPYAPASRLFWNELYLDLERAPGLERSAAARELIASQEFRRPARREVGRDSVDWRRVAELKQRVLADVAGSFDTSDPSFRRFVARRPRLRQYAEFRAAARRLGVPWSEWPARLRDGRLRASDLDPADVRYHEYVQFAMDEQLAELAPARGADASSTGERRGAGPAEGGRAGEQEGRTGAQGSRRASDTRREESRPPALMPPAEDEASSEPLPAGLYLDIPLGVHRHGYDAWANPRLFPEGISAGAPPDALFGGGQDWGFPPIHPEELRRSGYRYFIDSLRTVMPFAGALRFDHVMSLHRLYWIPLGFGAKEGTYVRYRPDEYYAILSLESHRHRTRIVGEDLGTVPQEVRARMGRHHIGRMYVLQYEAVPTNLPPVGAVIPGSVASLNTHDMPPFRGFWKGEDIADRQELGLADEHAVRAELRTRADLREKLASFLTAEGWLESSADEQKVLRAALSFLAAGDDWLTLAGLEDLWGEDRPQNVPGTDEERPNWRRRARLSLDEMKRDAVVEGILRTIDRIRRHPRNSHG